MHRYIRTILIPLFLIVIYPATGQDFKADEARFNNGKELLSLKKYGLAMQALKPLTSHYTGNRYEKIASFYYAVAAYHDGQKSVARDMFVQIAEKFPDWDKMDEVNLWLTNIYFEQGDMQKALSYASKIKNSDIRDEAMRLKEAYLNKLEYDTLLSMLNRYPSDKQIARIVADKIIAKPFVEQDRDLLENIVSVYELDKVKYRIEEKLQSIKKDRYQVALLLPFMTDDIRSNPRHLSNDFVIEMYEGIMMAVSELRSRGINISLNLYDTKKDSLTTARLLQLDEMKHMDLIIGPLFSGPVSAASSFAYEYKINMVHPLSGNSAITRNNPYVFLFMPSYEMRAMKAADYFSGVFENKNLFIFHGTRDRDSTLAYSYKKEIERNGFTVCYIKGVAKSDAKNILDILTNTMTVEFDASEFDSLVVNDKVSGNLHITEKDYLVIQPDSIGHLFLASNDPALAANTITGLETRGDSIVLVGSERWLEQRVISLGGLERLDAHLIAPTYIDKTRHNYMKISELYKETFNAYPTRNVFIGYEVMMTFGKLLHRSGTLFQYEPGINDFIPGEIFQGCLFGSENCNQVVPIIKFVDSELQLIYRGY